MVVKKVKNKGRFEEMWHKAPKLEIQSTDLVCSQSIPASDRHCAKCRGYSGEQDRHAWAPCARSLQ